MLVASIMAGSGSDKELANWQILTRGVQDAGVDAIELNFSCPHMDRVDMGANVGKDPVLCSVSTQAVKAVARVPVWVKLTPATANIVEEAGATFLGGADAICSSNTFPSLPLDRPPTRSTSRSTWTATSRRAASAGRPSCRSRWPRWRS